VTTGSVTHVGMPITEGTVSNIDTLNTTTSRKADVVPANPEVISTSLPASLAAYDMYWFFRIGIYNIIRSALLLLLCVCYYGGAVLPLYATG
jgi:hypothetical protein